LPNEKATPSSSDPIKEAFAKTLIKDTYVNAYLQAGYPDRFVDLAYANALAYQKIKPAERIFASSTKVMTGLLTKINVGSIKGTLAPEMEQAVNVAAEGLAALKKTFLMALAGETIILRQFLKNKPTNSLLILEQFGPFMEAPSLRHTEHIGDCSIYTDVDQPNEKLEDLFVQC
jgi:hypothetical protein